MDLQNVFKPINIAGIDIPNRIRMSPMALGYAEDGRSTERFARFFEERAKGGVGLIDWALWPYETEHGYFPWVTDDKFIPGLKMVVDAVHKHGTKIVGQFGTGYAWAFQGGPLEIVGPSGVNLLKRPSTPFRVGTPTNPRKLLERPMTAENIHEMVEGYGDASRRLREAEFDGVEIMLAAGYTLARFISPETNKRTDEYGGNLDNRLRIVSEIVNDIKKKAGADFPVFAKISGDTFRKEGYTLEECAEEIVPRLEDMGICCVDVVVGWHEGGEFGLTNSAEPGHFLYLAETVKKKAKVPIIGGSRTNDLRLAESVLAEGKIDMISLGRQLLADPETPNKARDGRFDDIRPCLCCCWCLETVDTPVVCGVNPRVGKESEISFEPAKGEKKVLVIGGGPGGVEAALCASWRGHKVTLMEKNAELGGMLKPAAVPPFKDDLGLFLNYQRRQIEKSNVEVVYEKEAGIKEVIERGPDVVVVATGGKPFIPDIPGIIRPNVSLAVDVLNGGKEVADNVVIIGGGLVGCELAEYLAEKGKQVTILEMLPRLASDMPRALRGDLLMRLRRAKIRIETDVEVTGLSEFGVWGVRRSFNFGPNAAFFEADSIVLASGYRPENSLAEELTGKIPVYNVGDSNTPSNVKDAIREGFLAGTAI
ncbi:putative NADH oxidase [delta proteobacterium NaphS2]|nr:putative NADH oxidase [delta proteobacterium NaphS2]